MSGTGHPGARRILVYGVTGSGKTTLARSIGEATGLAWTEADQLTWEPGWVQVSPDEQRRRFAEICAGEAWVLDTAYSGWLDLVLARADLVVALDYPRWVSLGRLVRRTVARTVTREQVCNGNVESLGQALSRDSIIAWHFRSFRRKRERIRQWSVAPSGPPVLRLTSPRQTRAWLTQLRAGSAPRH